MKKVWYIVKPGISRVTATALVEKGRNIVTMMTGNPAFLAPAPTPNPTLAEFTAGLDKLDTAQRSYGFNRGKLEKEARDIAFEEMKVLFHTMGGYVQLASNGLKDIILSAGFDVTASPTPVLIPNAPQGVRAEATRARKQILVRWGASKGRRMYNVYQTVGDPTLETGWELIAVTGKTRHMATELDSFQTYSYRIIAVGTYAKSIPSDAASAIAA
ncbi:MAG: fibronectin type III domain-containing protein [Flavobacteriales bacterium]